MTVAVAVHVVTLAVLLTGIYVVATNFPQLPTWVIGLPLILLAIILRPRFGSISPESVIMPSESGSALYGLVDRIAESIGALPPDVITFEAAFNAAYGHVGLRRRRELVIGLALWNALDDRQRIAVLGHEMAHQVNGDITRGLIVGTALRTLSEWVAIARVPRGRRHRASSVFDTIEIFAAWLAGHALGLFALAIGRVISVLRSLVYVSTQRAEYFADMLSARVGSTAAQVSTLDHMYIARDVTLAVVYAARRHEDDVWAAERKFLSELSPKEWERRRRLAARLGTAVDSTHPPTNLRIALLEHQPQREARITISEEDSNAIEKELESAYRLVGEDLIARFA